MTTKAIDVDSTATAVTPGPSLPGRVWKVVRNVAARAARGVAREILRVAGGFMAHGWTGRLFLANFALGIVATGFAWLGVLGNTLAGSWPLLLAVIVQWRFMSATARFGRYTRVAAAVMCAFMVAFSVYMLTTGLPQRLFALFLAETVFMLQCFLYFASPSYSLRAEEYRAELEGGTDPEG